MHVNALAILTLVFAGSLGLAQSSLAPLKVDAQAQGDALHIEISGRNQWNYEIKRVDQNAGPTIQLFLPKLGPEAKSKLETLTNPLVKEIRISQGELSDQDLIVFYLAQKNVESFDYITEDPSRLIVDFYQAKASAPPSVQAKETQAPAAPASTAKAKEKKALRAPAGSELLQLPPKIEQNVHAPESTAPETAKVVPLLDSGDPNYERFRIKDYEIKEDSIIASRENIYVRFPVLRMNASQLAQILSLSPQYEIKERSDQENKTARLLLTLFKNERMGAFLSSFQYFNKKFSNSEYSELIRYLKADLHYKEWKKNGDLAEYQQAINEYMFLVEKYPDSPLRTRTLLLLGYTFLEQKDTLGTIRMLQKYLDTTNPPAETAERVRIAMADAYLTANRFTEAQELYQQVQKSPLPDLALEAQFRTGDIYSLKKDTEGVVNYFSNLVKKYPKGAIEFPNAHFNLAESQFWLGQYREALDNHIAFIKAFPRHDFGGYAMTRIGEILEILGADQSRVMGAFLESYFRYQRTPGADIARIRMLSRRMKGMKEKELRYTEKELEEIQKSSPLPRILEFTTLMRADGYALRGDFQKALQDLISYYQNNPTSPALTFIYNRILKNISRFMKEEITKGNFLNALRIHEYFREKWLHKANRLDIEFSRGLSFEKAGVFKEADTIYRNVLNQIYSLKGTEEGRVVNTNQELPPEDAILLRLAAVNRQLGNYSVAREHLENIKDLGKLNDSEKIEKAEISSQIAERMGQLNIARQELQKLVDTWRGQPSHLARPLLRMARLDAAEKKWSSVLKEANQVLAMAKDTPISEDRIFEAMTFKADALTAQGDVSAASSALIELLDRYESKKKLDNYRYQLGLLHFNAGDIKSAERYWSPLYGKQESVYGRLAQERLRNTGWRDEYNKYLSRIPAMAERNATSPVNAGEKP